LDFSYHCPLCGGENCGRFFQYYTREAVDENGTYYKELLIARFICLGKGWTKESKGKTFSLLPYQLVPYIKYSIPFILKVLKAKHIKGLSIYKVQEYIDSFGGNEYLTIDGDQLLRFKELVMEAINRILATGFYTEVKELFESTWSELLENFIKFAENFTCSKLDPCIRGPCSLSLDFYLNGGGYRNNAYFLFGIPYQFIGA
jgi:hypothetical protein